MNNSGLWTIKTFSCNSAEPCVSSVATGRPYKSSRPTHRFTSPPGQPRRMRKKALARWCREEAKRGRGKWSASESDREKRWNSENKQQLRWKWKAEGAERLRVLLHAQDFSAARRTFRGRSRSVIDCNFDRRRTRARGRRRRSRQFRWRQKTAAAARKGERTIVSSLAAASVRANE